MTVEPTQRPKEVTRRDTLILIPGTSDGENEKSSSHLMGGRMTKRNLPINVFLNSSVNIIVISIMTSFTPSSSIDWKISIREMPQRFQNNRSR
jgi:hypothetical protein